MSPKDEANSYSFFLFKSRDKASDPRLPRAATFAAVFALLFLLGAVAAPHAQAQTFTVLHTFTGTDGANPRAGLVRDVEGNLYGTTYVGGSSYSGGITGYGTVFKVDKCDNETVLHSCLGYPPDGENPHASLLRDMTGNLYGTTPYGGSYSFGTVFKVDTSGNETVLHSFTLSDGADPQAGLIMDAAGNLYGTTSGGGAYDRGTVFKVDVSGNETVLHSFTGTDGQYPYAGLVRDVEGNLYGTTSFGGSSYSGGISGYGTVFKVENPDKSSDHETVLHSFTGTDGAYPNAGLVRDVEGNLYGTTTSGGPSYSGGSTGYGTVFKVDDTHKSSDHETVLYNFTFSDGSPIAGLVRDTAGNLYGTTVTGGPYGYGTVFKLSLPCTVTYSRTVEGNLNITSGSACIIDRDATGNVRQSGGKLMTTDATIGGNLQITGGAFFHRCSDDR